MSDAELYSRLLLPKGHGYPLLRPQPFDDFPRPEGVEIGDVGILTFDGSFDVFFNIRRHDDPVNRFGLPDGFEAVSLVPTDFASRASYHREGSHVSNKIIRVDLGAGNDVFIPGGAGGVVSISTSSKNTAILLLPDGASRTDLLFPNIFRDQALKHAESWYSFLRGLGLAIENGDLYLITGVDKSPSWSLVAVDERIDNSIPLSLKAAQAESADGSYQWEWETGATFSDSGPRPPAVEQPELNNQTIFLRGFKIMLSSSLFEHRQAAPIVDPNLSITLAKIGLLPPQARSGTLSVDRAEHDEAPTSGSNFRSSVQPYHPANVVNKYLLEHSSDVVVAVTHDDEWASVLNENEEEIPEESELIRRILAKYNMNVDAGGTYLLKIDPASKDHSEMSVRGLRFPGEKPASSGTPLFILSTAEHGPALADVARSDPESQQTSNIGEVPYDWQSRSQQHKAGSRIMGLTGGSGGVGEGPRVSLQLDAVMGGSGATSEGSRIRLPLVWLDDASKTCFPGMTNVQFCTKYGLGEEMQRLLAANGFDTADALLYADEFDLKAAHFKIGHIAELKWVLKKIALETFGRIEAPKTEEDNKPDLTGLGGGGGDGGFGATAPIMREVAHRFGEIQGSSVDAHRVLNCSLFFQAGGGAGVCGGWGTPFGGASDRQLRVSRSARSADNVGEGKVVDFSKIIGGVGGMGGGSEIQGGIGPGSELSMLLVYMDEDTRRWVPHTRLEDFEINEQLRQLLQNVGFRTVGGLLEAHVADLNSLGFKAEHVDTLTAALKRFVAQVGRIE